MSSKAKHAQRSHKTMAKNNSEFRSHAISISLSKYQEEKRSKKSLSERLKGLFKHQGR
jgi:hypothetical protein